MAQEKSKLQQMRNKLDAIDTLVDTLEVHHSQAYTNAAEKHLKKEGSEEIDYKKLKDGKVQEAFVQTMVDFYVEKAKTKFGIPKEKKLSEEDIDMLLSAYANITKGQLLEQVRENQHKYTLPVFKKHVDDLQAQVKRRMQSSAGAHIQDTDEDKTSIIKEMGLEDMIDPQYMTRGEVIELAATHHLNQGIVPPSAYEDKVYEKKANKERRERETTERRAA